MRDREDSEIVNPILVVVAVVIMLVVTIVCGVALWAMIFHALAKIAAAVSWAARLLLPLVI